jgi:hypothetical protein
MRTSDLCHLHLKNEWKRVSGVVARDGGVAGRKKRAPGRGGVAFHIVASIKGGVEIINERRNRLNAR